jgi:hypothetical protein
MRDVPGSSVHRVNLRLSPTLHGHLVRLAGLGEYGDTPTEVAENLLREQVVRLISTDFFERARRTQRLSPNQHRTSRRRTG